MNHEFAQHFKDIIWITYRSGFPELLKDCGDDSSFITDTGWGCMIRVGQMLFAQILRDFLKP
jgi:cysteine protease ATG4